MKDLGVWCTNASLQCRKAAAKAIFYSGLEPVFGKRY